jgi:hypothetical protein
MWPDLDNLASEACKVEGNLPIFLYISLLKIGSPMWLSLCMMDGSM